MTDDINARNNLEYLLNDLRGYSSILMALSDAFQQSKDFEAYSDGLFLTACNLLGVSNKLDILFEKIDDIKTKKPSTE